MKLSELPTAKFKYLIDAINVDYVQMRKNADRIQKALTLGHKVNLTTEKGTNLEIGIRGMRAISNDARYLSKSGNIPAGEVYIPPRSNHVNGRIIIDGSLKTIDSTFILNKEAIALDVRNGKVIRITGTTKYVQLLEESLKNAEDKSKYQRGSWFSTGRYSYYRTQNYIFEEPNFETSSFEFKSVLNNKDQIITNKTAIKLNHSIIEENKIKLKSDDDSAIIYYTLDDFNLSESFRKDMRNRLDKRIKVYSSDTLITLSPGQKLNAIAVNFNSNAMSNYLEGITLEATSSGQTHGGQTTQTQGNLSINLNEISNENVLCTKKVCYYKEWSNDFSPSIEVTKKFSEEDVYFAVNNLTTNYENVSIALSSASLSNNNISLGNTLNNKYSGNGPLNVSGPNQDGNFVITVMQEGTSDKDHVFFVHMSDGFDKIYEYKTLQKIINSVYCDGCPIPDWMPNGIIIDNQNLSTSDPDSSISDPNCKYTGDYEILCDFHIFNLDKDIVAKKINSSSGIMTPVGSTYFDEIKDVYTNKTVNITSNDNYNLFFDEKDKFNLTPNEEAMFLSIIGAESSFVNQNGDKNATTGKYYSFGLGQINISFKDSYSKLEPYLSSDIDELSSQAKYSAYFNKLINNSSNRAGYGSNKTSLYLALAVFKYNLAEAKKITNFEKKFSDVDKAFIFFYAHQFNIKDTSTFFNAFDSEKLANIDCVTNLKQSTANNRLGCIAAFGSSRKLGWYIFARDKLNLLNTSSTQNTDNVNLPYVVSNDSKLYIHTKNAPTYLNWVDAKNYCKNMNKEVGLGYDDWYLPSKEQMTAIWNACPDQDKSTACMNRNIQNKINGWSDISSKWYWTSSEYSSSDAYIFYMYDGYIYDNNKSYNYYVLCVRDHSP